MEKYKYEGIPLTQSAVKYCIKSIYSPRDKMTLSVVAEDVANFHRKKGGIESKAENYHKLVSKALNNLKNEKVVERITYNHWVFLSQEGVEEDNKKPFRSSDKGKKELVLDDNKKIKTKIKPNASFGDGRLSLYLYYLPYHKLKERDGDWDCKIGKSGRNPVQRILDQVNDTSNPIIEFVIYTDQAFLLEKTVHNILKLRGKGTKKREWFYTNPEEVLSIIRFITPHLFYQNIS
jgi:hypothetical protein